MEVPKDLKWESAYTTEGVKFAWDQATAGVRCPCGYEETIILEDEPRQCPQCHRYYRLISYVETAQ